MTNVYQIATLLPRFYEKNAQSIGNLDGHFKITRYDFGHDPSLIDNSTTPPTPKPYLGSRNDTPNKFYTGTFQSGDVIYTNGRLLFKCRMAKGELSTSKEYSLTVLRDADGDAVAVSVDLPGWVTPAEAIETHPFINFPAY